jgi:hypothetical protein
LSKFKVALVDEQLASFLHDESVPNHHDGLLSWKVVAASAMGSSTKTGARYHWRDVGSQLQQHDTPWAYQTTETETEASAKASYVRQMKSS